MIIPRFTIKLLLLATAIAAVLALVLRSAVVWQQPWAIALCTLLGGVLLVFFLFVVFWGLAWGWDQTLGQAFRPPPPTGGNPFASAGLPRQVIPPNHMDA
ncbi:hypothetical protein [Anatilimnocola floriformis]|uniref:hypothetical protein n=1 Tax=Anatilimnocola floriformis TaxID=2948575 RepID=UPI0020C324F0|nr:hypothetical protein [Anatilimnocola floriformis]